MDNKLKKITKVIMVINIILLLMLSSFCLATNSGDVTPPWGRLTIKGADVVDSVNYVESKEIEVEIYAQDDKSSANEIKYYISGDKILDTEVIQDSWWKTYSTGATEKFTLSDTQTNNIYVVLKDAAGNTSLIYKDASAQYVINYDANGGSNAPKSAKAYYGMPFVITKEWPQRENYYFLGWSTSKNATEASYRGGDIIPASVFSGTNKTITLYAVWTNKFPTLASVVKVGDYVNYPVQYNNVVSYTENGMKYKSNDTGWRVIGVDENTGTVNLISAGAPLTYNTAEANIDSVTSLTNDFLNTTFNLGKDGFRQTGFAPSVALKDVFDNRYTEVSNDLPVVRSIIPEDIYGVTGATGMSAGNNMDLGNPKYNDLFDNGTFYYVAEPYTNTKDLWYIGQNGNVDNYEGELGVRLVVTLKASTRVKGRDNIDEWKLYEIHSLEAKEITISGVCDYTYTGAAIIQDITVKYGSTILKEGVDYTVKYSNNTNIGTATMTVTGIDDYEGTKIVNFEILAPKYTIAYDANGGLLNKVPSSEVKTHDIEYTITSEEPEREGYKFLGWGNEKNLSTPIYYGGDKYTNNSELKLYAIWEAIVSANAPVLGRNQSGDLLMRAVYWDDDNATTEYTADEFTPEMYSYLKGDNKADTKKSRWANAKTNDGSYWVWIPRYAYKITYYTDVAKTVVSTSKTRYGSIDVLFLKGISNSEYYDGNGGTVTTGLPEGYKVHPAFQKMTDAEVTEGKNKLGKWDEELEGIWVAKYEASKGVNENVESKPSVQSWRTINQNDSYIKCINMNIDLNSHEMKNSEWGAVTYLTYSAYGRNGKEIAMNQCSSLYTGAGPGTGTSTINNSTYTYSEDTFANTYAWNTIQGKLASTTGNIYGIYDMSGGAYEHVSTYINNDYADDYGENIVNGALRNKQVYDLGATDTQSDNYNENIDLYGDALYETTTTYTGYASWCGDYVAFLRTSSPFIMRGGYYGYPGSDSGMFFFHCSNGNKNNLYGFRPVLCISSTNGAAMYQVTYDANGGSLDSVPRTEKKIHGVEYSVTSEIPSREGYLFKGWATSNIATIPSYVPSSKCTTNATITLYAVWDYIVGNEPVLGRDSEGNLLMQAVYWGDENATIEYTADEFTTEMYDYALGNNKTDTKRSRWANAKTEDGSYWVWIPRYAYKITYYTDETKTTVSAEKTQHGSIDVLFLKGISNDEYYNEDTKEITKGLPAGYKVHPAFQKMTDAEITEGKNKLGKWDAELEGIWVAKFEASRGSNGKVESKPSVQTWRNINQSNIYTNCLNMNSDLNSHEMKNSEWGAVAYLTYSAYGRNGNELGVNESVNFYSGAGPGTGTSTIHNSRYEYDLTTFKTTIYTWNGIQGKLASTTGNIYGVYDMSGGSMEYVAAYVNNNHDNLTKYGGNLISGELRNKQIYDAGANGQTIYNANSEVYGDAVYETSISYNGSMSWCGDTSSMPNANIMFFQRGHYNDGASNAGVFNFSGYDGPPYNYYSFRPVLCISSTNGAAMYQITYNANGGSLDSVPSTEEKIHNIGYSITSEIPSRERYTFEGWSTSSTATIASYAPGAKYTTNAKVTLYAVWKEILYANAPILGRDTEGNLLMEAVYWSDDNATTEYTADEFTPAMYSYEKGDGVTDTKQSRWANAKTKDDDSYWVWIPRYAYKITYYTDDTKATVSTDKTQYGSIDVLFLKGASNSEYYDGNGGTVTTGLPEGYKVHPAFQKMKTTEDLATNPLGKWDEELEGIWVAKYESSIGSSGKVESKPSVQAWGANNGSENLIGNYYTKCINMNSDLNSHMMKNSEWGAVVYLTYSAYGRNGNELGVNQCGSYYTGGGPGTGSSTVYNSSYSYNSSTFASTYAWNTAQGKLASTTGNIYGVYDIAGGIWENTASYINSEDEHLRKNGATIVDGPLRNKQIYDVGTIDSKENNYNANSDIYGDAIYETSGWNGAREVYPYAGYVFFCHGRRSK